MDCRGCWGLTSPTTPYRKSQMILKYPLDQLLITTCINYNKPTNNPI